MFRKAHSHAGSVQKPGFLRMLLSEDYSIAEIAEILHFSDQFYFCKFFKRHMNLTPSAYRRQMRKG